MEPEKRIFNFVVWLIALCGILAIVTSCSPLASLPMPTGTATSEPTATAQPSPVAKPILSITREICTVATGYQAGTLNIRKGPGTDYEVIRVLAEGELLQVINQGEWLKVITRENLTGFVNSKFCKEQE